MKRIRVLIVDDSRTVCRFLERTMSEDAELEVVGHALDAYAARDMIKSLKPDVLTLDVAMPKMDGVTFLKNLMRLHPMPVVMLSSLTIEGAEVTLESLEAGAVDFIAKRNSQSPDALDDYKHEIIQRVKDAARSRLPRPHRRHADAPVTLPDLSICAQKIKVGEVVSDSLCRLVAIGASAGGPAAMRQFLADFHVPHCALVISQHMPAEMMSTYAERLDKVSQFEIRIAQQGEIVRAGCAYIAPGDTHLQIQRKKDSDDLLCNLSHSDKVDGQRPCVDIMFDSIADTCPRATLAFLLTGMGADGAAGLNRLHKRGATTIIQDRETSQAWGMPGHAYELGAVDGVLSLPQLAPASNKLLGRLLCNRIAA